MKILAAKKLWLLACLTSSFISLNAEAGIPVIDGGNLTQNVLTAMESVAQTLSPIVCHGAAGWHWQRSTQ